jgi:hypothetical protein
LLKQKGAPKVAIILDYFIFSKNHNEPPKVAQLAKKSPNLVTLHVMYSGIIWQGNCLGYFSKNWANFLPKHLVTLSPNKVGLFSKTFLSIAILD